MGGVPESELIRQADRGSVGSKGSHVARWPTYFHFLIHEEPVVRPHDEIPTYRVESDEHTFKNETISEIAHMPIVAAIR